MAQAVNQGQNHTASDFDVTEEAKRLISIGLDVIPLKPRSKGEDGIADEWTAREKHTVESFLAARVAGGNMGLRTGRKVDGGFLHVLDFDVDDPTPEAMAMLDDLLPPGIRERCPTTRSGNASGQRRHFWFLCDVPLKKATRYLSNGKKLELLGDGQQAVLPPSIHPKSNRAYEWIIHIDEDADLIGGPIAPLIPAERCLAWGARRTDKDEGDSDEREMRQMIAQRDFEDVVASGKLPSALDAIGPEQLDYDGYFIVVGAMHYGSGGSEAAREMARACVNKSWWYRSVETGEPIDARHWTLAGEHAKINGRRATVAAAAKAFDKTWSGLKLDHPDPTRIGSIFKLAQAAGWTWGEAIAAAPAPTDAAGDWTLDAFDDNGDPDLSHDQLALDLGRAGWNRDALYCAPLGGWLLWRGQHWEVEPGMRPMAIVRSFLRTKARLLAEWAARRAAKLDPKEGEKLKAWAATQAKALRQDANIAAVERLARSNVKSLAEADQFDADDWLLGTPGGTVELRTGELREAQRADFITMRTSVTPAAPGTRPEAWLRFLDEVFSDDPAMPGFIQRLAGYALTGSTREHRLFLFHGSGRNGKGTLLGTLQRIMGDYARGIPTATLLEAKSPQHASPLARLRGARLVRGAELPVGQAWNESLVKQMTGGDTITANLMRQDAFDFAPKFTLIVDANTRPRIRTTDVAMRSRMTLIPFKATFAGREDRGLPARLEAEGPAILRWAIEGAVDWQRGGLGIPATVEAASREYLDSEDSLADFLADETEAVPGGRVTVDALYNRYRTWAADQGMNPATKRAFGDMVVERKFERTKLTGGTRGFTGLRLRDTIAEGDPDPFA